MDTLSSAAHDNIAFGPCPRCKWRDVAIVLETPDMLYVRCGACGTVTDWVVNTTFIAVRRKPSRRAGEE